jgi:hypothetical protein
MVTAPWIATFSALDDPDAVHWTEVGGFPV